MVSQITHYQDQGGKHTQGRPEASQPDRQLLGRVKVGRKQDGTRDEATLAKADKSTGEVVARPVGHESLCPRDGTPAEHHDGQDAAETVALDEQLNGKLGGKEGQQLDRGTYKAHLLVIIP